MKVGIEVRIDVTKIDKARLFKGKKGTYLNLTTFVDLENVDEYGNSGFISHKKNEGEEGNTPILGNVKVFWKEGNANTNAAKQQGQSGAAPYQQNATAQNAAESHSSIDVFDEDIPF